MDNFSSFERHPTLVIVDSIAHRDVSTIDRAASVRAAARVMVERNVGSVVVTREGAAEGILTEGDVARRVVAIGLDPDATPVHAVMSAPLATIEPSASVETAAEKMRALRLKRLVVVLDQQVRGIVTATDIAYAAPSLSASLVEGWVKARWED